MLPQRARSQSPWCQYWSSAACWPLWVSGSFLQICWRGTATVHPKHWDVPTQQTGTAYRFVHQISVFWHKMMLPCMFCSEKWKSMWGIGFTFIKKNKSKWLFSIFNMFYSLTLICTGHFLVHCKIWWNKMVSIMLFKHVLLIVFILVTIVMTFMYRCWQVKCSTVCTLDKCTLTASSLPAQAPLWIRALPVSMTPRILSALACSSASNAWCFWCLLWWWTQMGKEPQH